MKESLLVLLLTPITIFSFVTVSHSQYATTQHTNNAYHDYDQILGAGQARKMLRFLCALP